MSEEERNKANSLFLKPAKLWTGDDKVFLNSLFIRGFRSELKSLRASIGKAA